MLINKSNPHRFKLSPTSVRGIFVGYCESSTQYHVYIPTKNGPNKVIVSANVRFHENDFWNWEKSSIEQFGDLEVKSDDVSTDKISEQNFESIISDSDSSVDYTSDINLETSSNSDSTNNSPSSPFLQSYEQLSDLPENIIDSSSILPPTSQETNSELSINPQAPRKSTRIRKTIPPRSAWQPVTG